MSTWVTDDEVIEAMQSKSAELLIDRRIKFCMSDDFQYCVVLKEHAAWQVTDGGWRYGNYPPEENEGGRPVLSFLHSKQLTKAGFVFRAFVPQKHAVTLLENNMDSYRIKTESEIFEGKYGFLEKLMWDVVLGWAEPEEEIEKKFNLLCNQV